MHRGYVDEIARWRPKAALQGVSPAGHSSGVGLASRAAQRVAPARAEGGPAAVEGVPGQVIQAVGLRQGSRAEYAEQQFLLTEWSDPTEPVTVTRPSHLLAGSVKGTSASREAEATLLVLSWNAEKGVLATKKKEKIRRGAVANFASEDVLLSPPGSNKPEQAKVDLQTDSMLVDMFGGEKLPGTDVSPSEVLLLEADGQLAIQSQYTDAKAFYSELARLDKLSAAGPSSAPGGATSDFSDPFASMSAPPQGSSKKKSAKKN